MKITFVASESNPFIKTGGLADVVYSLAKRFAKIGNDVSIIIPLYSQIRNNLFVDLDYYGEAEIDLGYKKEVSKLCHTYFEGINFYFVENDKYFDRKNVYGEYDDGERFSFFTLACRDVIKGLNLAPDIIHIHDWQVSMLPFIIKYQNDDYFINSRFVLTIHNPLFQGAFDKSFVSKIFNAEPKVFSSLLCCDNNMVSFLKTGIYYADKITTVSPNHSKELLTKEGGYGLQNILSKRIADFVGVLNGIDYEEFDTTKDRRIHNQYNLDNYYEARQKNKELLLNRFNLPSDGLPLYGFVSRLSWQKGISLVLDVIRNMVQRGAKFIILGQGDYDLEQQFEQIRREFPSNVGIYIGYNNDIAHQIYSGADFLLVPSIFEPCGLTQMISQHYGCMPIVRATGGLKDSVIPYGVNDESKANGFVFEQPSAEEFIKVVNFSFDVYWNLPLRKKLMLNGMKADYSWEHSAEFYMGIFREIIK